MQECGKCRKSFKTWVLIDGTRRNLKGRKYCLKCSPFGRHNTKKIELADRKGRKTCSLCERSRTVGSFYKLKNGKRYAYCKECDRKRSAGRSRELKRKAVEYKGGKCEFCGYKRYQGALDFHHEDPKKKDFQFSRRVSVAFTEAIRKELDKCLLVCKNCHAEIHGGALETSASVAQW